MKYRLQTKIRFSEVDEQLLLTLPNMINYLQDCATFHGEETPFPLSYQQACGNSWMQIII